MFMEKFLGYNDCQTPYNFLISPPIWECFILPQFDGQGMLPFKSFPCYIVIVSLSEELVHPVDILLL